MGCSVEQSTVICKYYNVFYLCSVLLTFTTKHKPIIGSISAKAKPHAEPELMGMFIRKIRLHIDSNSTVMLVLSDNGCDVALHTPSFWNRVDRVDVIHFLAHNVVMANPLR